MSGWKGGGLLLVLAVPLALYAAWQGNGVVRTDMVVSAAPPDRGGTREQLAAGKAKAAEWAGDVRRAAGVAHQYRQRDAGDATAAPVTKDVIKGAEKRAAYLTDLDQFLSGVKKPEYKSEMAASFIAWAKDMEATNQAKQEVENWLREPLSDGDLNAQWRKFDKLLRAYSDAAFANPQAVAVWRLRGRLKVLDQLAARARAGYDKALEVRLPLKPGDNALVATLDMLRQLREWTNALAEDEKQAEAEKADTSAYRADAERLRGEAVQAGRNERLLALFARADLFANSAGAAEWLGEVAALYRQGKEAERRQIRNKVQEFCEAFIPAVARLDDEVLVADTRMKRDKVQIKFRKDGVKDMAPLAADPAGLTEFNFQTIYPGEYTFVLAPGDRYPDELKPTDLSKTANDYNQWRREVPPGKGGLKWTAKSVEDLKNKCVEKGKLVDQLKPLRGKGETGPDEPARIFARLEGLLEGLKAQPELTDGAP